MEIKKAIIPAAGYGTRFLPATKASPKEMLPIVDKPVIQYVVEEAVKSGIKHIIIITGANKRPIEDHFDYNFELEYRLHEAGKDKELAEMREIATMATFTYIRQKEHLGNGHAVLCAKEIINHEPFAVLWGDEFMTAEPPRIKQMMDAYEKYPGVIMSALRTSKPEDTKKYGFGKGEEIEKGLYRLTDMVEKPGPKDVPSDIALVGGYILVPEIFDILEKMNPGKGGEIWLTDAIKELINQNKPVYAKDIDKGKYYDCGDKLEYLKANIDLALGRADLAGGLKQFLDEKMK